MVPLEDVLAFGVLPYLQIKDCQNLQFINKTIFHDFKTEYWATLFLEKYNLFPCFTCEEKHVESWMLKNSHGLFTHFYGKQLFSKFILCFQKKKEHLEKTQAKS